MKTFSRSQTFFKKVRRVIPLASQTFSKSFLQFVEGQAPLFISRGEGPYVWDVDGNKYLDLVSSLLAVNLGYQYPAVDKAITKQLKRGITFSLASPLEYELAKTLSGLIPCAEMVRFGKNGSDATAGAVRLARAITKKDHIFSCGYHGWQDWYIGLNPRNEGVPRQVKNLVHGFQYNNIDSLEKLFKKYRGNAAAVIMEPMTFEEPKAGFLQAVKRITHKNKALLIFDEIVTGFRFALGGAQEYFNVIPDLAAFGKSMANGMPISVVAGKTTYMKKMEDIFFSFTFGGETLSLAASLATIQEMKAKRVIEHFWKVGSLLKQGTQSLITKHDLEHCLGLEGKPCWHQFVFKPWRGYTALEIQSYLQQELIQRGLLWIGTHDLSFSHKKKHIEQILRAYDQALAELARTLKEKTLRKELRGKPIQGNYSVRKA